MELTAEIYLPIMVWAGFVCLLVAFGLLYRWAKKRKSAAFAVGLIVQMFLPDPKVEQTIEFVSESKEQAGKREKEKQKHGST